MFTPASAICLSPVLGLRSTLGFRLPVKGLDEMFRQVQPDNRKRG